MVTGLDSTQVEGKKQKNENKKMLLPDSRLLGPDCFGSASQQYADVLMDFVNDEYSSSLYYAELAHKSSGVSSTRIFKSMAGERLGQAKRFAASYFLITGKQYFPVRSTVKRISVPQSYIQALRQRYIAETKTAMNYSSFSQKTGDKCLAHMAQDAADKAQEHANDIMGLLQKM